MVAPAPQKRGRLLFLAPVVPAVRGNGLAMRVGFFLTAYARRFDVDLAVIPIVASVGKMPDASWPRIHRAAILGRPTVDTYFQLITAVNDPTTRLSAFRQYGRPSLAAFVVAETRAALKDWIDGARYDVMHVSRLYLAPLIEVLAGAESVSRPRLVIDCDEDDSEAYRRLAALARRQARHHQAAWAEAEADAFARLAQQYLLQFDQAFVASEADARSLAAGSCRLTVIPNVAPPAPRWRSRRQTPVERTILFVGTMSYAPNEDAARWFITRIWPRLQRVAATALRLILVGSNPTPALRRLGYRRDVVVTGTVADVAAFYRDADLAVIPIRAGGGTRIKLLEAAVHGVPIVSTTFGAQGTTFRRGRDLLLADSEEAFVRACGVLLRNSRELRSLAARARLTVMRDYDSERWALRVGACIADLTGCGVTTAMKANK